MSKKTWSVILKAPALLVLIGSFLIGLYAAYYNIQEMGWEVSIILGTVLFLYFLGSNLGRSYNNEKEHARESKKLKELREEVEWK